MSETNKIVATVFLNLENGAYYEKLVLILEKFEKEGLISTVINLLSDCNQTEKHTTLHDTSRGLVYEIFFNTTASGLSKDSKHFDFSLVANVRNLFNSWDKELLEGFEFSFQSIESYKEQKKLFVFDMDSTLIKQEVIDEMAKLVGVGQQVSEITESAMRGEIDFKTSLKKRVALLSGAPVSIFDDVRSKIQFSEGAKELCSFLKSRGCILAVVSGGFLPLANYVKTELNLDYAFANQLESVPENSTLTGETLGEIVTAEKKALILKELASKHLVPLQNVVAVGDGANDLLMMDVAGLSVAFNAKPKVQEKAIACINRPSLLNLTFFLGFKSSELV